ncbi:MAG: T9SS type A sorting domain-containing protein [Ignavibacteriales bacterium]|nr:T9SS type A sorting domain-containing protein [Ignavibacteriales bacterium]
MKAKNLLIGLSILLLSFTSLSAQNDTIVTVINPWIGGSITGGGEYLSGSHVTLEAFPNSGYEFTSWTENNVVVANDSVYSFISSGNRTLYGNFNLKTYNISVDVNPVNSGNVTGSGNYEHGSAVTLEAIPNIGYNFKNWTEKGLEISTDSVLSFTADKKRDLSANFELKSYNITTDVNPIGSGSITGDGIYQHGTNVTLEAIPSEHYQFVNWTENNLEVTTDSLMTFLANGNRNLIANFKLKSYSVSSSVNPINGGNINGDGDYLFGSTVNLEANPTLGYSFLNWTENNLEVSTDTIYSFTINQNRELVANFSLDNFLISTNSNPLQGGVITGGGLYDFGQQVNLVATPAYGYNFYNWTENGTEISTDSTFSFLANSSRTITANFLLKKYNVTTAVNPIEGGVASGDSTYDHGSMAQLKAMPTEGWKFDNWKENNQILSINSIYNFVVFNDHSITANFSKKIFTLTLRSNPNDGGITVGSGKYQYDSLVTITATPNNGWNFVSWNTNDTIISNDSLYSFRIKENKIYTAIFKKKEYNIATQILPENGGLTLGDSIYTHGDIVKLNAIPDSNAGYDFVNWTENSNQLSVNPEYTFAANDNRILTANFRLRSYTVELSKNPSDAGNITGAKTYTHGDSVTISAVPNAGWLFANWTEGQTNVSNNPSYTFKITGNKSFTANFAHELYSLNSLSEPVEAGFVSGSGSFYYGQVATLIPVANTGWEFVNWMDDNNIISTDSILVIAVTKNANLKANFTLKSFSINCSVNPLDAGFTSGCGLSFYNQEMILSASPNSGWEFKNWTENGEVVSTVIEYNFNVEGSRDIVANFDLINGIEENNSYDKIPDEYYLSHAFPNPFNPATKINFGLPEKSNVKIFISNINGQIVKNILSDSNLPAGNYYSDFNAENLSSGVYFYIFFAQSTDSDQKFKKIEKLILVK